MLGLAWSPETSLARQPALILSVCRAERVHPSSSSFAVSFKVDVCTEIEGQLRSSSSFLLSSSREALPKAPSTLPAPEPAWPPLLPYSSSYVANSWAPFDVDAHEPSFQICGAQSYDWGKLGKVR